MNIFFNHVPGFRSNTTWKMIVAIFYYGTCVAAIPQSFLSFIIVIALPFIVFAIKDRKKEITPLVNRTKLNKVGVVLTVIWFALMVSMGTSMDKTTKETDAKLIQQQKVQAVAKAKVDANNKILAIKKIKTDKIIADKKAIADKKQAIIDKKVADAKAIKDKETARLQAITDKKIEDARIAKEAQAKQDIINKNTKTFSSGEYTVGTHLDAGIYEFTFIGSGNLTVTGADETLISNEIGGSDMGVSKYRSILTTGCKIKISGMQMKVVPTSSSLASYGNTNLSAGYWVVGKDVTKGRYTASTTGNSGNFLIYNSDGTPKTNEILGIGENAVKETVVDLNDGDLISISALNSVNFKPTN